MQHSRPTLTFTPFTLFCPLCISNPSCFWLFFYTFCFLFSLTCSEFFNKMLEVSEPVTLNYYTLSCHILLTLSVSWNLTLTRLPLSGFSALRSDHTHFQFGILSSDDQHTSITIFIRQGLFFLELSTSSLSSLDPYSDCVGVNISLNIFSLSFLNDYTPPVCSSSMDSRTDSFFSSLFPPLEISLFREILIAIIPSGTQKVLLTSMRRKYLIGSFPQTSFLSMTQLPSFQ